MAKTKVELNLPGLNEVMKSAEMQAALLSAASSVASSAGSGYGYGVHQANFVAIANVFPDSAEAAKDNYENNSIVKAAGAAGLRMG